LVFPGPGSGLPSKKWGDRVSDDPVVDVDEELFPFPLELLDPHPPARAATTIRAAAPSEAEQRSEVRFDVVIAVLHAVCNPPVRCRDVLDDRVDWRSTEALPLVHLPADDASRYPMMVALVD
jgi:hypothetical protein